MQLLDLKDSKDAVYGALDAWVAWEQNFPIASVKRTLLVLEKEQQWHRVVQVVAILDIPLCISVVTSVQKDKEKEKKKVIISMIKESKAHAR